MTSEPTPVVHRCECRVCHAGSDPELVRHHHQINLLLSRMSEPQRRWYVATLADEPQAPTIPDLSRITGLDPKTIQPVEKPLPTGAAPSPWRKSCREWKASAVRSVPPP